MVIPYQTKLKIKRAAIGVGIGLAVVVLLLIFWLIWLQRFIVYTDDGVYFDFNRSTIDMEYDPNPPTEVPDETVVIRFNDDSGTDENTQAVTNFQGTYLSTSQLIHDMEAVQAAVANFSAGDTVMLDVKSIHGNFYYSSGLSSNYSDSIDQAVMDSLIQTLADKGVYLIARLPAFRDTAYATAHTSDGIPTQSGYLWLDDDKCYWLDPASQSVLTWLVQITRELKGLGFDEVVFYDFRFPSGDNIGYDSQVSTDELISKAAQWLADSCNSEPFRVSFEADGTRFPLPTGSSRLYLSNIDAGQVQETLDKLAETIPDITTRVAFFTDSRDTRFDAYGVLRPLELP